MLGDPRPDRPETDECFGDCGWTVKVSKGVNTIIHNLYHKEWSEGWFIFAQQC